MIRYAIKRGNMVSLATYPRASDARVVRDEWWTPDARIIRVRVVEIKPKRSKK